MHLYKEYNIANILKMIDSELTRLKKSLSKIGSKNPMYGKKLSQENKKHLSKKLSRPVTWITTKTNCWECNSHYLNHNGYPIKGDESISRLIYKEYKGEIPKGIIIRHTCDNRICINPQHLILGNHQDNMKDRQERNRQAKGEAVGTHKLTEQQVKEIRSYNKSSYWIAKKYDVTHKTILLIKNKQAWKHLE